MNRGFIRKEMKKQEDVKIGVAWHREDQWHFLRSTASDPETIEERYQDWLQSAEKAIKLLNEQGFSPVKVDFDVKEFNDWCKRKGRAPDAESRSIYVADLLRQRH